ncbi:hypothetical protein ABL78_6834 [Leptomonas seymouri]|uniref:Uncharacterized protein n=1 Tax=Leptomonas seymouri TaxID=5684 RepID=A0A0N1HUT6_LEPSE|nr:hypothetical protein ABL78_6834 [Leptomonas seymouri]|eukprot:KPI84118.1 hypothetical protein ABL78_6834 [Leptomonas seymouri]
MRTFTSLARPSSSLQTAAARTIWPAHGQALLHRFPLSSLPCVRAPAGGGTPMATIFSFPLHSCIRHASTERAGAAATPSQAAERNDHGNGNRDQQKGRRGASASFFFEAYRSFRQARHTRQDRQYQTLSMYLTRLPPGIRELLLYSPFLALLYFVLVQARAYYLDEEESWYMIMVPSRWRYSTVSVPTAAPVATEEAPEVNGAGSPATSSMKYTTPTVHVSSLLKRAPTSGPLLSASTQMTYWTTVADAGKALCEKDCVGNDEGAHAATSSKHRISTSGGNPDAEGRQLERSATATTYAYLARAVHDAAAVAAARSVAPPLVAPFHEVTVRRGQPRHAPAVPPSSHDATTLKRMKDPKDEEGGRAAEALARHHPYGVWEGPLQVLRDTSTSCVVGYAVSTMA